MLQADPAHKTLQHCIALHRLGLRACRLRRHGLHSPSHVSETPSIPGRLPVRASLSCLQLVKLSGLRKLIPSSGAEREREAPVYGEYTPGGEVRRSTSGGRRGYADANAPRASQGAPPVRCGLMKYIACRHPCCMGIHLA